jgi:hypothetical protein
MKKTSKTTKRGRGRPKKETVLATKKPAAPQKVGIPAYLEPTDYDLHDELARLDSYAYARHN